MADYLKQMVHKAYKKYLKCLISGEELAQGDIYHILRTPSGPEVTVSNDDVLDFCQLISGVIDGFIDNPPEPHSQGLLM